jgi:hypothetical protein
MARQRRRWAQRLELAGAIAGAVLVLVSAISCFVVPIYQQAPGAWMPLGPVVPGTSYTVPPGTPPAGKIRVRLMAGSLIVANGHLPPGKSHIGMVTLGEMSKAGFTWLWNSPATAWQIITRSDVWKWYIYTEHVQVHLFPVGLLLAAPWALRRWVLKGPPAWVCQECGYDLRGGVGGPCPECGHEAA